MPNITQKGGLYLNDKHNELLIYKNRIVNTINKLMYDKRWSIKQLSDESELPYESVKKIVGGKINNPTIYSLNKICQALNCSLDYLLENKPSTSLKSHTLPPRVTTLLTEIANFEIYLSKSNTNQYTNHITTLIPTGVIQDGMLFDSFILDSVDISAYTKDIGDITMCGLKVTGNALCPTYLNGDVLLIARDRFPFDGEIGVFIIGNKCYIRQYYAERTITLKALNNNTDSLEIKNIDDIHFFGRVLTIVRK